LDDHRPIIDFDHHSAEFARDPAQRLAELRSDCPVAWSSAHGGFWALTRLEEVSRVLSDPATFSSRHDLDPDSPFQGVTIPPPPMRFIPVEMDPPEFVAYRRLLNPLFSRATVDSLRPRMRACADWCLDQAIESGRIDLVYDLASPVPAMVTLELLGLPVADWPRYATAYHDMVAHPPGTPRLQDAFASAGAIAADLAALIAERRADPDRPRRGAIDALLDADLDGSPIPDGRLLDVITLVLAGGTEWARDLEVPGRELDGIQFAMDFLTQQNKRGAGDSESVAALRGTLTAAGKHVIVIGGGDTGSDCIGTAVRQGAASITQLEILPKPPDKEDKSLSWPNWPLKLRTSSSQEEGCERDWSVLTKRAVGSSGRVTALDCVRVDFPRDAAGRPQMTEIPGSTFQLKADLVLLAMGFLGPKKEGMIEQSSVALDARGNVRASTEDYRTSVDKIFAAGDMRRGQSLVVWAIREGRQCARAVDEFLMGTSTLPR